MRKKCTPRQNPGYAYVRGFVIIQRVNNGTGIVEASVDVLAVIGRLITCARPPLGVRRFVP